MSSLIFFMNHEQALVATDTLATYPDGRPFKFTTKAFIVPHLRLIMAGVGMHSFLGRWFVRMNDMVIVRDIDNLDYHTTRALTRLWEECEKELSIPDTVTTTVYHLGFSQTTGLIHGYAYRSANNFVSERLQPYGLRLKPECQVPTNYQLPRDFVPMMNEQRTLQESRPRDERLYIGGEIEVHHLTKHGFGVSTIHRFDDYARDEAAIFENCKRPVQRDQGGLEPSREES